MAKYHFCPFILLLLTEKYIEKENHLKINKYFSYTRGVFCSTLKIYLQLLKIYLQLLKIYLQLLKIWYMYKK